jgi:hypothetical protein
MLHKKMNKFVTEGINPVEGEPDQWKTPSNVILDLAFYKGVQIPGVYQILNSITEEHKREWMKTEVYIMVYCDLFLGRWSSEQNVRRSC